MYFEIRNQLDAVRAWNDSDIAALLLDEAHIFVSESAPFSAAFAGRFNNYVVRGLNA
jgi:hypothetical protein